MTVVKVVELIGISSHSWDDAVKNAVESAAKTVNHITGVQVINATAKVKDGKLTEFRATVKLVFGLTDR